MTQKLLSKNVHAMKSCLDHTAGNNLFMSIFQPTQKHTKHTYVWLFKCFVVFKRPTANIKIPNQIKLDEERKNTFIFVFLSQTKPTNCTL